MPIDRQQDAPGRRELPTVESERRFRPLGGECYCGLGPACPAYRQMSDDEREACTANMRAMAQALYMNGMG